MSNSYNPIGQKLNLADDTSGNLPVSRITGIPVAPTGNYFQAANQAVRLALGAVVGDICLQLDTGDVYLCTALPSNNNANWGITNVVIAPTLASAITFTPTGGIAATDVQAMGAELDSEKGTKIGIQNQTYVIAADTGAADAYAIATAPAITGYVAGQRFGFAAVNANTGASTLAVSGLAATPIRKIGAVALQLGDILAGQWVEVVYDGTNFQMVSRPGSLALPYVKVSDSQAAGTNGGSSTSGSFLTRTINTENSDTLGICTLAANQITLAAGTYKCRIWSTYYKSTYAITKLRNTTAGTDLLIGSPEYSESADGVTVKSWISGPFTVAAAQALEVQYRVGNSHATFGLGVASNYGLSETYLVAEFEKVA